MIYLRLSANTSTILFYSGKQNRLLVGASPYEILVLTDQCFRRQKLLSGVCMLPDYGHTMF